MKRKTSSLPTRIYTYGIVSMDTDSHSIIMEQLFEGNKVRNQLVALERERRAKFRTLRSEVAPQLAVLEMEKDGIVSLYDDALVQLKKLKRTERDGSAELDVLNGVKKKLAIVKERLKKMRQEVDDEHFKPGKIAFKKEYKKRVEDYKAQDENGNCGPHIQARIKKELREEFRADCKYSSWLKSDEIQEWFESEFKRIKNESPCYPGTKAAVSDAAMKSFSDSMVDPAFKPFDGGRVERQLLEAVKGKYIAAIPERIMSGELRNICITPVMPKLSNGGEYQAKIRLANDVYVTVNFIMHRPLPQDSSAKFVRVLAKRVGNHFKFELQFVIEFDLPDRQTTDSLIALDIGWRVLDDGSFLVATSWDGKETKQLKLPSELASINARCVELLGYADKHLDNIKVFAGEHKEDIAKVIGDRMDLSHIHKWRSSKKMRKLTNIFVQDVLDERVHELWRSWKKHRGFNKTKGQTWSQWRALRKTPPKDLYDKPDIIFAWASSLDLSNDECIAVCLEWWRRKDIHLTDYARNTQHRLFLRRREIFRVFASQIAKKYDTLVIAKLNRSKLAEKPKADKDRRTKHDENTNSVRQFVGPSILVQACKEAFRGSVVELSGVKNLHHNCGGKPKTEHKIQNVLCGKCEKMFNHDLNYAKVLYHRGSERSGGAAGTGSARKSASA